MIVLIILAGLAYMLIGAVLAGLEIKYEGIFYTDLTGGLKGHANTLVSFFVFAWPVFVILFSVYIILRYPCRLLAKIATKIAGEKDG